MNFLRKLAGKEAFTPQTLDFEWKGEKMRVSTTAHLAEGGYSFVYSAKEVGGQHRTFAAKKVLAQDPETRRIAEMEISVLEQVGNKPGVVGYFGSCGRELPGSGGHREYWMLLELCSHGSLIDLLYRKGKAGDFDRRAPLSQARVLEVFESMVCGVVLMHAQLPPIAHRDLKVLTPLPSPPHATTCSHPSPPTCTAT